MKRLLFIIPILSLLFYSSCHLLEDPEDIIGIPQNFLPPPVEEYVEENYPDFTIEDVEKDEICGDNSVRRVELENDAGEILVIYYDMNWDFLFTATPISNADLPGAVMTTIETEYPDYTLAMDASESYELSDGSLQYKVELTGAMSPDLVVVLNEDGSVVCSEEEGNDDDDDDDDEEEDVDLPMDVLDFINSNYDGYEVDDAELEELCGGTEVYEVELEDGPGPDLELYFDLDWEFLFAASEIEVADLPASVIGTIEMEYPDFDIEEAELYEFPDGSVQYYVELEGDMQDVELVLNEDGSIACSEEEDDDDDDDGISPPGNIIGFINSNYGGQGYVEAELDDLCGDVEVYLVKLDEGPGQNTGDLDVYFDLDWEFLFDAMEVLPSGLPTEVEGTLEAAYPGYIVEDDDVEQYNMADGSLQYKVELETSAGQGVELTLDADGNILCER